MTTSADREDALRALDCVTDPVSGKGLAAAGLVQALVIKDGRAGFVLEAPAGRAAAFAAVREAAEKALAALPGIERAQVVLTAAIAAPPPPRGSRLNDDPQARLAPSGAAERPAHVRKVIAVASGKGGVGKSTVAVNLACALALKGLRVGLADGDIFGPSAPLMLGVSGQPKFEEGKLIPFKAHGIKVMSIGFIAGDDPLIFRGPRASGAVRQVVLGVDWASAEAPLDVLVIDLPPGTGDVHLTVIQGVTLDGVVLVTTPQEAALIDARRGSAMFEKTGTPILGLIENMSYFADPATGQPIPLFGAGGGAMEAERLGVPLLAQVPIEMAVREGGDNGAPIVTHGDDGPAARALCEAADKVAQALGL